MRAARIELASFAWKADILAIIRRPQDSYDYSKICYTTKHNSNYMADLNQFLNQDLTAGDVAHSSGMGAVAGGGGAGGLSMDQRRKLLNQPRVVSAYHYSRLGRQGSASKARAADQEGTRVYDASSDSFNDKASSGNRQHGSIKNKRQIDTKSVERRQHFIEPTPRNYDKFS